MSIIEYIGLIGGLTLAYSNIPQIVLIFKQKHAGGISKFSTWLWLIGLSLKVIYTIELTGYNKIILGPYVLAFICCGVTLFYCYFPRGKN